LRISENDTDLRWLRALLCELADLVNDLLGGGLEPCRGGSGVWDGGLGDTLSFAVETTHGCGLVEGISLAIEIRVSRRDLEDGGLLEESSQSGVGHVQGFLRLGLQPYAAETARSVLARLVAHPPNNDDHGLP
jgi:hypothetical protein